jgi:hypothetical protein
VSCALSKLCPGQLVCSGVDVTAGSSGCTYTNTDCTDGHTYGAHCGNGATTCDCQKDGMDAGSSFNVSSDLCGQSNPDLAIKAGCGFTYN